MHRVAILAGTGFSGEDLLYKVPWVRHAKVKVATASRIDPRRHFEGLAGLPVRGVPLDRVAAAFDELAAHGPVECVYSEGYDAPVDPSEEEKWLRMPFAHIIAMNRLFHNPATGADVRDVAQVRRALARYVRFFRDFYARHGTKALLTTMEDDLFCLAGWAAAKRMGIRVIGTLVSRFPRRGLVFADDFDHLIEWHGGSGDLDEVRALYKPATVAGDAPERTGGYWDLASIGRRFADAKFAGQYDAFYRNAVAVHPDEGLVVPPAQVLRRAVDHAKRMARRYGIRRIVEDAPSAPFVLFPLHFTEDAQITFREPMLDQVALVRHAARSLPHGHVLAVKPHPHYMASDLALRDVRRMAETPNVHVLRPELPGADLLAQARAVLIANSTTGFEAMVHGTPVVAVGHDWFIDEPQCRVVRDPNELPLALADAIYHRDARRSAGEDFVQRAWANTVWTEGEAFGFAFYGFTDADGRAVASALEQALDCPRKETPRVA